MPDMPARGTAGWMRAWGPPQRTWGPGVSAVGCLHARSLGSGSGPGCAVLREPGRALCSLSLSFSIWERGVWAMSRWSGTGLGQASSGLLLTVRGSTGE